MYRLMIRVVHKAKPNPFHTNCCQREQAYSVLADDQGGAQTRGKTLFRIAAKQSMLIVFWLMIRVMHKPKTKPYYESLLNKASLKCSG